MAADAMGGSYTHLTVKLSDTEMSVLDTLAHERGASAPMMAQELLSRALSADSEEPVVEEAAAPSDDVQTRYALAQTRYVELVNDLIERCAARDAYATLSALFAGTGSLEVSPAPIQGHFKELLPRDVAVRKVLESA